MIAQSELHAFMEKLAFEGPVALYIWDWMAELERRGELMDVIGIPAGTTEVRIHIDFGITGYVKLSLVAFPSLEVLAEMYPRPKDLERYVREIVAEWGTMLRRLKIPLRASGPLIAVLRDRKKAMRK